MATQIQIQLQIQIQMEIPAGMQLGLWGGWLTRGGRGRRGAQRGGTADQQEPEPKKNTISKRKEKKKEK